MSTLDTLLDKVLNNGYTVLTIDEPTRSIQYDGELILGVEGDKYAERIYFVAPKIVGDGIDLLNARIDVKFTNGYGDSYYTESNDAKLQDDGNVMFSWLLTEKVAITYGNVPFSVCVKTLDDNGSILQEWHTVPYTGKISKGVDATLEDTEIITDFTVPTYEMVQEFNKFNDRLDQFESHTHPNFAGVVEFEEGVIVKNGNNQVGMSVTSGSDQLEVGGSLYTSGNLNVDGEILNGGQPLSDQFATYDQYSGLVTDLDTLTKDLTAYKLTATQFKKINRFVMCRDKVEGSEYTENTSGIASINSYLASRNEIIILVQKDQDTTFGTVTSFGVTTDSSSPSANNINFFSLSDAPTYNIIRVERMDDDNLSWTINNQFSWSSLNYHSYYLYYVNNKGLDYDPYRIIITIYGR